jgi:hypothetical protein
MAFMTRQGILGLAGAWTVESDVVGPGDKHDLFCLLIIGRNVLVGKRPADPDAVFRLQAKIIGMVAGQCAPGAMRIEFSDSGHGNPTLCLPFASHRGLFIRRQKPIQSLRPATA